MNDETNKSDAPPKPEEVPADAVIADDAATDSDADDEAGDGKPFVYKPLTPEDFPPGQEYARDLFFTMKHAAKHGLPPFDRVPKKEKKPKAAKRPSVWDD